jgi:hypothetical protein
MFGLAGLGPATQGHARASDGKTTVDVILGGRGKPGHDKLIWTNGVCAIAASYAKTLL